MKKLMVTSTVAAFCAAMGLAAAPQVELAATAELASFGEITKKVQSLGAMINNPIVPALVLGAGQQQLVQTYGAFRSGSPIFCHVYVRSKVLDEAVKKGAHDKLDGMFDTVLLYPSVDGMAKMALNHVGSTKGVDGTLHLPARENQPKECWVKFTDDGRYCAYARSAELAVKAAMDFSRRRSEAKTGGGEPVLLRVELNECGLKTLLLLQDVLEESRKKELQNAAGARSAQSHLIDHARTLQSRQNVRERMLIDGYSRMVATFDLDDTGFTADCRIMPKAGAKPLPIAGFRLPAGVLDDVPAGAPLFGAMNPALTGGYFTEDEFRADCTEVAKLIREDIVPGIKKDKETMKYSALIDELGAAAETYLLAAPYPSVRDWNTLALAFDAQYHPYITATGDFAALSTNQKMARIFADRAFAAFEKQWPGHAFASRDANDVYTFDWSALIDIAAEESKVGAENAKEVANAKKTLEDLLGDTKTVCSSKSEGTKFSMLVSKPGFTPPAVKSTGEASIAKALPETVKDRPAGVFYLTPYALARDVILPMAAKRSDKEMVAQYQTMLTGMAPAAPNSACAGAIWYNADGSMRGLLRITAGEVRNLGAAFNAFTAASMSSADDDDK